MPKNWCKFSQIKDEFIEGSRNTLKLSMKDSLDFYDLADRIFKAFMFEQFQITSKRDCITITVKKFLDAYNFKIKLYYDILHFDNIGLYSFLRGSIFTSKLEYVARELYEHEFIDIDEYLNSNEYMDKIDILMNQISTDEIELMPFFILRQAFVRLT